MVAEQKIFFVQRFSGKVHLRGQRLVTGLADFERDVRCTSPGPTAVRTGINRFETEPAVLAARHNGPTLEIRVERVVARLLRMTVAPHSIGLPQIDRRIFYGIAL